MVKEKKEDAKKEEKPIEELIPTEEDLRILKSRDFFNMLTKEISKKVVGEEETIKTILLICLGGMLTRNAEPTSTNLMVNDESGAGKDYIVKKILELLPENKVEIRKRITEKVFTYWHNAKFEPDWSWDGKVFYNEDISNSILNSDVFKVMSSSDGLNKSTVIIKQSPIDIITKGKPVMVITIASANPKQELLRRYPMINMDTSEAQTKAILKRKAEIHSKGAKPVYSAKIIKALMHLKRVKVKVPFSSLLVNVLSTKNIIIRTHFDRFIDYMKFSAAIHQFQREEDEEEYVVVDMEDYEYGRLAILKTMSNVFSVPLTKTQQNILKIMEQLTSNSSLSVMEIEPNITFISDRQLRRELDKLVSYGFLVKNLEYRGETGRQILTYKYAPSDLIIVPVWDELTKLSNLSNVTELKGAFDSCDKIVHEMSKYKEKIEEEEIDENDA